jgi:hypothetical protein
LTISDGSLSEDLYAALGTLIRIDPRAFLEELREHRRLVTRLDALVGNFGPDYVDKADAREREKHLRIKALQSVTDPSLSNLREQCVNALKQ